MSFYNAENSSYLQSNNRIPKDSVVFVKEQYELSDFQEIIKEVEEEELKKVIGMENNFEIEGLKSEILDLLKREEEWRKEKEEFLKEIQDEKNKIEAARNQNELEKKRLDNVAKEMSEREEEFENNKVKFELEKKKFYLENKNMAWKMGIEIAEEVVAQKVNVKDLDVEWIIMELLKKMPSEFSKLDITVSPETYDNLKENKEANWLFAGAEWTYDFRLKFGEFILRQDDEYKVFVYDEVFNEMHEIIENKERFELDESTNFDG